MKKLLFILFFLPLISFSQTKMIVNYVKTDSIKARSNWVEVIDSTNYQKDLFVRDTSIIDLITKYAVGDVINIGTANQIPFVNPLGTDLYYSSNLEWNGKRLLINYEDANILIGNNLWGSISSTSNSNIIIGTNAAANINGGDLNTLIGNAAGSSLVTGGFNVMVGASSGFKNNNNNNVFLGYRSGLNNTGTGNIFIGKESGYNETGSNKLYIDNSNTSNPLIKGDFSTDELWLNTDTTHIAGHLEVDSNLYVNEYIRVEKAIHLFHYFGDSAISKSYTTSWQHLTNATDSMFIQQENDGFTVSNDTITITNGGDYDFKAKFALDADNGETVSIRFYNITQAMGIPVAGAVTGRAANNFMSLPVEGYQDINSGDKIVLQYKGDANGTTVLKNGIIKIYLIHD